jgi:hypothetical protein
VAVEFAAMDEQAGWLVDRDDALVLVNDGKHGAAW